MEHDLVWSPFDLDLRSQNEFDLSRSQYLYRVFALTEAFLLMLLFDTTPNKYIDMKTSAKGTQINVQHNLTMKLPSAAMTASILWRNC